MRSSLVVEPMEVLHQMVPTNPATGEPPAGEEAPQSCDEQTGAGGALAKLRGNLGAEAPTSGVLGGLTKAVMSDGDLQRAIVGQGSVSLPDVGTWGVQPGGDTSPLWSDEARGLGFGQVLLPLSRQQLLATRYLKRVRSATTWDAATQQLSTQRPFEGAIRIGSGRKLKSADMFDGSDPYCEVFWNGERVGTTRVCNNTLNPEFDEAFRILVEPLRENTLRVAVFDHDDSIYDDDPDFLGEVKIASVGAGSLPKAETEFALAWNRERKVIRVGNRDHKEDDSVSGTLSLHFSPVADLMKMRRRKRRTRRAPARASGEPSLPSLSTRTEALRRQLSSRDSASSTLTTAGHGMGPCVLTHRSLILDLSFRKIFHILLPESKYRRRGRDIEEAAQLLPAFQHWQDDALSVPPGPTPVDIATGERPARESRGDGVELALVDSVKLERNRLDDITGLTTALRPFLWRGELGTIVSLDLSGNCLTKINVAALCPLTNLLFLYLHANQFGRDADTRESALGSVAELAQHLTKLSKLTMHGSGLDEAPGYRARVLLSVPWLRELDYTAFTANDRAEAKSLGKKRGRWRNPWLQM